MKSIQLLTIFLILAIINSINLNRKKSQSHSKASKTKSLANTGLYNEYFVRVDVGTEYDLAEGYFNTASIRDPSGEYLNGLYFNTPKATKTLKAFAGKDGNRIFVPYRLFGNWVHDNPWTQRRYIATTVTFNGKTYEFKLRFDIITISTSQQGQLCSWLNTNTYRAKNIVRLLKGNSIEASQAYINKTKSAQASIEGSSGFERTIKELVASNNKISEDSLAAIAARDQASKDINATILKIEQLSKTYNEEKATYKNKQSTKSEKEKTILQLNTAASNAAKAHAEFTSHASQLFIDFNTNLTKLRKEATGDNASLYIGNVEKAFIADDVTGAETNLKSIITGSG